MSGALEDDVIGAAGPPSGFGAGEPRPARELLPLVYDELRRLAAQRLAREVPGQTLQATALVHEAYMRLVGRDPDRPWDGRGHFFAAAAEAMRRILVENARRRHRVKRGGNRARVDSGQGAACGAGDRRRPARARRGPGTTRQERPGQGAARSTSRLRRPDCCPGSRGPWFIDHDRRSLLGLRPGLAPR